MTTVNDTETTRVTPPPGFPGALSNLLNPKIASAFLTILSEFDGSPGLQALILGLVSLTSGTAMNLLTKPLGAVARLILLAPLVAADARLAFVVRAYLQLHSLSPSSA